MKFRFLLAAFALVLFAADATAGPFLNRLRGHRSGGCTPSYVPAPTYVPVEFAVPSCAGGRCALPR